MAKKRIRFVGLLLAAVMVLGMGAVSVAAEDNADAAAADSITLTDLAAKLNANDGKVTLDKNVVVKEDETAQVKGIKNIVIDLGGKTLDATNCASRALPIVGADTVKITNGTIIAGTNNKNMLFVFRKLSGGLLPAVTVENVEIDFRNVSARNAYTDLFGLGSGVKPTFDNCTVLVKDTEQLTLIEPFVTKANKIDSVKIVLDAKHTFNGGNKVVKGNVYNKVEIDLGGNTLAVSDAQTARMIRFYNNAAVTIKNGSIKLNDNSSVILVVATGECKPTVTFDNINFDFASFKESSGNKCAVLTNSQAENAVSVNANCTMTVADLAQWKAAQNFAAKYKLDTFNAVLAEDITTNDVNDQFTVKGFKNVVINLNGKTFSVLNNNSARMIPVYDANSVIIKNGTVKLASAMGAMIVVDRSENAADHTVTYESVKFDFAEAAKSSCKFNTLAYPEAVDLQLNNCTMPEVALGSVNFDEGLWKVEQKFARTYPIYGKVDTFNVVLSADTTAVTEKFAVTGFKNVVIDLNGHKLISANDDNAYRMMPITGAEKVTVKNGTIELNGNVKSGSMMFVFRKDAEGNGANPNVSVETVKITRDAANTAKLFIGGNVSYKADCVVEKVVEIGNMTITASATEDAKGNKIINVSEFFVKDAYVNDYVGGLIMAKGSGFTVGNAESKVVLGGAGTRNTEVKQDPSNVIGGHTGISTVTLNCGNNVDSNVYLRAYLKDNSSNNNIIYSDVMVFTWNSLRPDAQ